MSWLPSASIIHLNSSCQVGKCDSQGKLGPHYDLCVKRLCSKTKPSFVVDKNISVEEGGRKHMRRYINNFFVYFILYHFFLISLTRFCHLLQCISLCLLMPPLLFLQVSVFYVNRNLCTIVKSLAFKVKTSNIHIIC